MTLPPPSPRYGTTGEVLAATLGAADLAAAAANPIHNGGFMVWQRGTTFGGVAHGQVTADRWVFNNLGTTFAGTVFQGGVPPLAALVPGAYVSYLIQVATADVSIAASDLCWVSHRIEGYNWLPYVQKQFTIGFWVYTTVPGIYCVAARSGGSDRSCNIEYTVNASNTWEYKTVTFPASPAAGTWNYTNGIGVMLDWMLACGSTFQATAGSWSATNTLASANQVNAIGTAGNIFALWGVTMGLGSTVAPFWPRQFGQELALCQRYYTKTFPYATAPAQNSGTTAGALYYITQVAGVAGPDNLNWDFPVTMRATPTVTTYNPSAANNKVRNLSLAADSTAPTVVNSGDRGCAFYNAQVAGDVAGSQMAVHADASADL